MLPRVVSIRFGSHINGLSAVTVAAEVLPGSESRPQDQRTPGALDDAPAPRRPDPPWPPSLGCGSPDTDRSWPEIWIGAHGPRMLRAVERYGDAWFPGFPLGELIALTALPMMYAK
jgi:hypothetical protein